MLQHIRDKFTGLFAGILLGMLAISFVFFGIGNFNFLGNTWAAKVDDVEISVFQLENAYQNRLLQIEDYSSLPPETLQLIRGNVLDTLIRDTLLEVHVANEGYRVGDEQVAELIQAEPSFREDGVFKKELYYAWLDQIVMDARVFEAQQRQGMRRSQLQRGIGATAFVTPGEYRRYLNLYAEQRIASIATFDIAALAETIVVSDEDVQAYYDARPDDYRAPESVDFQYLELDRNAIANEINVSEDALAQYYADNSGRFLQDEQRRARHILITFDDDEDAAEEQARALTARAQAGEPFADLAQQYSKDSGTAGNGGDLGAVLQSSMPGALGDTLFSIDVGEIYGPVRTDFGFHVVRVDEVIPGGPLPLDQVRGELLQELRAQGVDDRFRSLERQLTDAVFDASDLSAIAGATGLELKTASTYTRAGGEPFGANQTVIETVFDPIVMTDRQISDVVEIDASRSLMVQVTAHYPEQRRPLDEVRDTISFQLQSSRAVNIIEDRSRRLREALQAGSDFAEMAFELEAEFTPDVALNRYQDDV
ncbi:MAG: peptidyl-prolyl cis-trans isomerase, partial [Gammaproteobacteria bacterium]|nr:peptidyl-prolyl cis-trans isomerase [Gammaproteobacteria bacterium]